MHHITIITFIRKLDEEWHFKYVTLGSSFLQWFTQIFKTSFYSEHKFGHQILILDYIAYLNAFN